MVGDKWECGYLGWHVAAICYSPEVRMLVVFEGGALGKQGELGGLASHDENGFTRRDRETQASHLLCLAM